jgi:peptidoglycan/LPS O-acetylase OafA/YrhL
MGNGMLKIKLSKRNIATSLIVSLVLQIIEGYWYWTMGDANCGTQLKLSSLFTGTVFAILSFRFTEYYVVQRNLVTNILKYIGDISFGIYFSHLAVMMVLEQIPFYSNIDIFPLNGMIALVASMVCIIIGKKILGKYSKYLAL